VTEVELRTALERRGVVRVQLRRRAPRGGYRVFTGTLLEISGAWIARGAWSGKDGSVPPLPKLCGAGETRERALERLLELVIHRRAA
jgi:hypothetical protein